MLQLTPSAVDKALLKTENLTLSYAGKLAFKGVSLSLKPSKITTLIGPSGCGKSSFLLCLNRLIDLVPKTQLEGEIEFAGKSILGHKVDTSRLRRQIGMIFQRPNPFALSIKKNLELPLKEHRTRDKKRLEEIIETTLKQVGLWDEVKDRLNQSALLLSGGQQQRLCIARALVLEPRVLLMDEPCSALDPISSGTVEDLILSIKDRCSLLIVTHNLAQSKRIADETALFWFKDQAGHLLEQGPVSQIFENPQHPTTEAYVSGRQG